MTSVHMEDLRTRLLEAVDNGWKPAETLQQQVIAFSDTGTPLSRELIHRALFGIGQCPGAGCGNPFRIEKLRAEWDLQLYCDNPRCDTLASLHIELKPWGAPPHYSVAELPTWKKLVEEGVIVKLDDYREPGLTCGRGKCSADCKHSSYRSNPALPQIIVPRWGVPSLLLTDLIGDVSSIYGTRGWGYEIAPKDFRIRQIAPALVDLARGVEQTESVRALSASERTLIQLVFTALWMRTPPAEFRSLTVSGSTRALIDPEFLAAADAWVARHPA